MEIRRPATKTSPASGPSSRSVTPARVSPPPAQTTTTATTTTKPLAPPATEGFSADGTSTSADAKNLAQRAAQTAVGQGGGVLGFLIQKSSAPVLETGPAILAKAQNASSRALLDVRARALPEFSPLVEVTRADGSTATGLLRGVDPDGRALIDGGRGARHAIPLDEELRAVKHQMDTDGDLHTALVTVFDAQRSVTDPWRLEAYAGEKLVIERYDAEHPSLAAAAKKGDVFDAAVTLRGAAQEGLIVDGGVIGREDWKISRIEIERPAWSYKSDGARLSDVGAHVLPGTEVEVTLRKGRALSGTFLGMAKDSEGDDHLVLLAKNGTRHALREDVVDVRAPAVKRELWADPTRATVYSG